MKLPPRTREEFLAARAKADLLLRAYRTMGYDAVLPGEEDFLFGIPFLRDQEKKGVPFVCLNLVVARTGKPLFPPHRRFSRGNADVLVTGLVGANVFPKALLARLGLRVLPPAEALASLLGGRETDAGVTIVLSHQGVAEDLALARRANRPLLILGAHSRTEVWTAEQGAGSILSVPRGKGMVLQETAVGPVSGASGKRPAPFADGTVAAQYEETRRRLDAGRATMDRRERELAGRTLEGLKKLLTVPEGKRLATPRSHTLDETVPDDPRMVRMIGEYKKALERIAAGAGHRSSGMGAYRGHGSCAPCHPDNHAEWRREKHAGAYGTLVRQGDGGNPDCLPCHVTGYGKGGYRFAAPGGEKDLEGVGCESCHGPGEGHPGRKMAVPGEPVCLSCHGGLGPFPFTEKRRLLGCVRVNAG